MPNPLDPLEKLKHMYTHVANDPSATNRSAPGDRLREAATRLETAIRAEDRAEVVAIARQAERELYHLERFMRDAPQTTTPPAQGVESRYQAGVQAHQQGWLALGRALETGDPTPCAEALSRADEGDDLLAAADTELRTLRDSRPIEG